MNIPLLTSIIELVVSLFKHHAPEVVQAAETAAAQTAVTDPKVQAGIAAYQAIQNFKTAINTPERSPVTAPFPGTAAVQ